MSSASSFLEMSSAILLVGFLHHYNRDKEFTRERPGFPEYASCSSFSILGRTVIFPDSNIRADLDCAYAIVCSLLLSAAPAGVSRFDKIIAFILTMIGMRLHFFPHGS